MKLNPLSIILAVCGQAILIACFLIFRGGCPDDILWLNIVVSSIIYWLFAWNFVGPAPIELDNNSGSRGASLGISWTAQIVYAIVAIAAMVFFAVSDVEFKYQIIAQIVFLFFMLVGLLSAHFAREKAAGVYAAEQRAMMGKREVKFALQDVADYAQGQPAVPQQVKADLRSMADECRYITPSRSQEACTYDDRIFDAANALRPALADYEINAARITSLVGEIRRQLQYRRRCVG